MTAHGDAPPRQRSRRTRTVSILAIVVVLGCLVVAAPVVRVWQNRSDYGVTGWNVHPPTPRVTYLDRSYVKGGVPADYPDGWTRVAELPDGADLWAPEGTGIPVQVVVVAGDVVAGYSLQGGP